MSDNYNEDTKILGWWFSVQYKNFLRAAPVDNNSKERAKFFANQILG